MHKSQSFFLFNLITALRVSGVTTTHPQEHKATASTASGSLHILLYQIAAPLLYINIKFSDTKQANEI